MLSGERFTNARVGKQGYVAPEQAGVHTEVEAGHRCSSLAGNCAIFDGPAPFRATNVLADSTSAEKPAPKLRFISRQALDPLGNHLRHMSGGETRKAVARPGDLAKT